MNLNGMTPEFAQALEAFLGAAPGGGISITSGYRSPELQAQLWENALAKYGSPEAARKWVAPPGNSYHNKGLAADLGYSSDELRAWAHANAADYGLYFPMSWEPWHIELQGTRGGQAPQPGRIGQSGIQRPKDPGADAPKVQGNALAFLVMDDMRKRRMQEQQNALGGLPFQMV